MAAAPDLHVVGYFHLLWTGVLAGLALLLSIRFPYPETSRAFYVTLALLAACGLAALPLLGTQPLHLLWLPFAAFLIATAAFVVFSVQVIRSHFQRLKDRRHQAGRGQ